MKALLTFKEKRYVQQLISNSSNLEASLWPEWAAWVLFTLGGVLIIFVGFIFLENPNAFAIKHVLLPGVAIGMALTLFGTYIQRMSNKAEEKQVLAGLVKKLMA